MGFAKVLYAITLLIALTLIGLAGAIFQGVFEVPADTGNRRTNAAGTFCSAVSLLAGTTTALACILGLILDRDSTHSNRRNASGQEEVRKPLYGSSSATLGSLTIALGLTLVAFGLAIRMFNDRFDNLGSVTKAMGSFAIILLPFVFGCWLASLLLKRTKSTMVVESGAPRRINPIPMTPVNQPVAQPVYAQQPAYAQQPVV
ncbi:hypothetical protein CAOG_01164 [Capsaspora owczarzaki ATCC 30864]|uniref:Uncharacterized protein n=1 Tax=Capsaspora owczarzaki (strain ATCC 30864) TaxID=595528 RepID=A0A0D2WJV4_CAPO3|nr:hypothetical protein CAOG_01164 [Capsaspora owczarzaki ATCC 30864]KJE89733.1 hypothetical protein, variant 1 [Capsaspora owczarzaki ATCC 30864]|eukprot:XP_004366035.1 hypothetical protein CAOG_01164 [Capsaspora owczarzaki ATCC 30864]